MSARASDRLTKIQPSNLQYPLWVRLGSADVREFLYTIARESYGQYLPAGPVEFVMDLGANIGDTTAWFLSRYPKASVIAVEPDPKNFELLRRNVEGYQSRALPELAGVWPYAANLALSDTGTADGVEVREAAEGDCRGVTIPELMAKHSFPRIDYLKCDIEGAEKELFSGNSDAWLAKTNFIAAETHGDACLRAVLEATTRHGFQHRRFRDLHIFSRSKTQ